MIVNDCINVHCSLRYQTKAKCQTGRFRGNFLDLPHHFKMINLFRGIDGNFVVLHFFQKLVFIKVDVACALPANVTFLVFLTTITSIIQAPLNVRYLITDAILNQETIGAAASSLSCCTCTFILEWVLVILDYKKKTLAIHLLFFSFFLPEFLSTVQITNP